MTRLTNKMFENSIYMAATVGTVQSSCGHSIKDVPDVTLEQLGRSLPEKNVNDLILTYEFKNKNQRYNVNNLLNKRSIVPKSHRSGKGRKWTFLRWYILIGLPQVT